MNAASTQTGVARVIVKSKYLIVKHAGNEVSLVFSPLLSYEQVAREKEVRSAGFCELRSDGQWKVSGRSEPLRLNAGPRDAEILNDYLSL